MTLLDLPIEERLDYLVDLLSCTGKMYSWIYRTDGSLVKTNCPDLVLDTVFKRIGGTDAVLDYSSRHRRPLIVSNPLGLMWGVAFEYQESHLSSIHVFGPVSTADLAYESIREALNDSKVPTAWRPKLMNILNRIPVTSTIDFFKNVLMLHYCVTGEKLTTADITFQTTSYVLRQSSTPPRRDRMVTWMAEQHLMEMVRQGDLNYKDAMADAIRVSRGVNVTTKKSLDQVKVSQIVFISLCTRAAIEGGLSPEVAYSRGDAYIQDIMDCANVADVANIGHTMYEDFIRMVHHRSQKKNISKYIQSTCDFIDLHASEKLSLTEIAGRIGYTEYYLSRKFKQEMGISINDYIKKVKVDRAKTLLTATDLSIQEICDQLNFGSRSFFSEIFRKVTGTPPASYREAHRHP